jgi:hypothetical protein
MKTLREQIETIHDGFCSYLVFPKYDHVATGTDWVRIDWDGTVTVRFCDGSERKRIAAGAILSMDIDNLSLFDLVGFVKTAVQA